MYVVVPSDIEYSHSQTYPIYMYNNHRFTFSALTQSSLYLASLQQSINSLHQTSRYSRLVLIVNPHKTEIIQATFHRYDSADQLHGNVPLLTTVNSFTYLGCIISDNGHIDEEILQRINLTSASFRPLRYRVFSSSSLRIYHQSCCLPDRCCFNTPLPQGYWDEALISMAR